MNIVVLDGYTLNPGDLNWAPLADFGSYTVHDRTNPDQIIDRAKDTEIVLTNKTILSRDLIKKLQKLKYIGVLATGYNVVDVHAAHKQNIVITNIPAYGTQSVVQMVFAHLLNFTQRVAQHAQDVKKNKWSKSVDFCYWDFPLVELANLTMGIVGFGRIGRAVAQTALSFNMRVLAHDTSTPNVCPDITFVDLKTLFRKSDVISLHCPLTAQNKKFVSSKLLSIMKPSAFLINTARGPLIDEQALADALNADTIAGAGLDVLEQEPPPNDCPLLKAKNCWITPHIAWATRAARQRLLDIAAANIRAFLAGSPVNVI